MNATSDVEYAGKTHVSRPMDEILNSILRADLNACDRRREKYETARKRRNVARRLFKLYEKCPRFKHCTLANYEAPSKSQKAARDELQKIGKQIGEFIDAGRQLFLWGNVGTGKDHLAIATLRRAAFSGRNVVWREGLKIYREIADAYRMGTAPELIFSSLLRPDVLCLSDPIFARGMTDSNRKTLQAIVRDRYDQRKPTWVTCNVKDMDQAKTLFGEDVLDRLLHRATVINCNWKSYRS